VLRAARQRGPAGVAETEALERTALAKDGANMVSWNGEVEVPLRFDAARGDDSQDLLHADSPGPTFTRSLASFVTCHERNSGVHMHPPVFASRDSKSRLPRDAAQLKHIRVLTQPFVLSPCPHCCVIVPRMPCP
jgi:hypothetical protein